MTTIYVMSSPIGVNGLFYILGFVQIVAFTIFSLFLKETKGLKEHEKKEIYLTKEKSA